MEKNIEKLLSERLQRLHAAINLQEGDRVPIYFPAETWLAPYAGFSILDMVYNSRKFIKAIDKLIEEFQWDCLWTTGAVWPGHVLDAVGRMDYNSAGSFQIGDQKYMDEDEYPDLIADPYTYIIEKMLPRRCHEIAKPYPRNAIALAKSALAFGQYRAQMGSAAKGWLLDQGMPSLVSGICHPPFEMVCYCRGLKNILLDTKRRPEVVKEACEALLPLSIKYTLTSHRVPPNGFSTVFMPLDSGTFFRPQEFEEFYWPGLKRMVEAIVEKGYYIFMMLENEWEPYFDYLAELPKGKIIAMIESRHIEKAKAALGKTMCIAGNIPCDLLGYASKDECIDYTKKLIDTCAPGGGFIICSDREMIAANDAKVENLLAVTEFAKEYGVYN